MDPDDMYRHLEPKHASIAGHRSLKQTQANKTLA